VQLKSIEDVEPLRDRERSHTETTVAVVDEVQHWDAGNIFILFDFGPLMNLLLLLIGVRVWSGSPLTMVTRVFVAVSLFSVEMQLVTWTGLATLRTLPIVNVVLAAALLAFTHRTTKTDPVNIAEGPPLTRQRLPLAMLGALVLALNLALPLTAADPYHLMRADRIEQVGTLAYDTAADPKLNVLGWLYELIVADVQVIPVVGQFAIKFHGVAEVVLFALGVAAAMQILGTSSRLAWALLLVVPVVFHQFVLVKNDLFGAVPAFLVLSWLVARVRVASSAEVAWAAWLFGIALGTKLTSFPLAIVAAGVLLLERRNWPTVSAAIAGSLLGFVSAGLFFTLVENVRVYGAVAPFESLGNRNAGVHESVVSVGRFFLSLFDMGQITRRIWPGRGGWAGTYGLPLIWALTALLLARETPLAKRTLLLAGIYWVAFAAVYPDADIAHRLAIAPGLLVIAAAGKMVDEGSAPRWLNLSAIAVIFLSAAQILRSAELYFVRG